MWEAICCINYASDVNNRYYVINVINKSNNNEPTTKATILFDIETNKVYNMMASSNYKNRYGKIIDYYTSNINTLMAVIEPSEESLNDQWDVIRNSSSAINSVYDNLQFKKDAKKLIIESIL